MSHGGLNVPILRDGFVPILRHASQLPPRTAPMTIRFAYNTNGTAHHRLDDALALIADSGYDGVALTLDIHHLDPFAETWAAEAGRVASLLERLELACVIETGARFLLDPNAKHEPTLVTADAAGRARRVGFLKRAVEIGAILSAEAVSFWAGVPKHGVDHGEARRWLGEGLHEVAAFATQAGIVPCLEAFAGSTFETRKTSSRRPEIASATTSSASPYISAVST